MCFSPFCGTLYLYSGKTSGSRHEPGARLRLMTTTTCASSKGIFITRYQFDPTIAQDFPPKEIYETKAYAVITNSLKEASCVIWMQM